MAEWKFVIGTGTAETYELRALDRKIKLDLKATSSASFSMNLTDPATGYILPLITDLKIYRDDDKVFRGRFGQFTASLDENSGYAGYTATDYRGILERRFFYEDDNTFWYGEDVATVVWDCLTMTQTKAEGSRGITQGIGFPTLGIIRNEVEFAPGANIMQSLTQIAENKVRGFEWDIDMDLKVNVWGVRGNNTPRAIDYRGAATSVDYNYDTTQYANAARATSGGSNSAEEIDSPSLAGNPKGRWEAQLSWPDIETQEVLEDRTQYLLEQVDKVPEEFTLKLRQGWWQGPTDVWLGDTIVVKLQYGSLNVNQTVRVHTIDITLDEDGREEVSLVVK